jgi:hypothetical protein
MLFRAAQDVMKRCVYAVSLFVSFMCVSLWV